MSRPKEVLISSLVYLTHSSKSVGEVYSGDFTMDGYLENHGYSIENRYISTTTNGTNTLSPNPVFG